MKKYWKALVNIAVALVILLLVVLLVPRLLIFFSPFVVAWVIALLAAPPVRFLEVKLKLRRKASSVFVIILVIALVVLIMYLVGAKLVEEIVGLIGAMPDMWASAESDFQEIGENLSVIYNRLPENMQQSIMDIGSRIGSYVGDFFGGIGSPTLEAVGNFARSLPSVIIGIIMALLASYFFVAERGSINEWFRKHTPVSLQRRYLLVKRSMVLAVGGYLKAQLKIEVWMYLLLVAGLSILQVNYAFLIAVGIAFLDLLPFFGTGTVMVPWAIVKILSGDYKMAIGLLIIWGVGQLVRQMIQPKIVGDSIGVPPIPTLFLLYAGYKLYGVLGMIIAVPFGLILYTMYEEGVFDTTKNSVMILVSGINRFRRFNREDLKNIPAGPRPEEKTGEAEER
ncbi:MAG: sporulation integral membrane protein YtvI [Roseburia sp.]|nr:sporulation integral membrane protein YtvI [Roseburia sp.]